MAKLVEVTALRPHRSGYAPGGRVAKDGSYIVPADRVPSLVRLKLVADPSEPKAKQAKSAGDDGETGGDEDQG